VREWVDNGLEDLNPRTGKQAGLLNTHNRTDSHLYC